MAVAVCVAACVCAVSSRSRAFLAPFALHEGVAALTEVLAGRMTAMLRHRLRCTFIHRGDGEGGGEGGAEGAEPQHGDDESQQTYSVLNEVVSTRPGRRDPVAGLHSMRRAGSGLMPCC